MTRAIITDHVILRYLERVLFIDMKAVRRAIEADTATAVAQGSSGVRVNGLVYRLRKGYVTTVLLGDPLTVRLQTATACKKIMRSSRKVPLLVKGGAEGDDA